MANLRSFLIFIAIVLLVYGGINYIIYRRILQAAAPAGAWAAMLRLALLLLILAYPLGRTLLSMGIPSAAFTWIGAFWLGAMTYGLMIVALVDFVRLSDLLTGWLPNRVTGSRILAGRYTLALSTLAVGVLAFIGHMRSLTPVLREVIIEGMHLPQGVDEYRLAVFADTHLGTLVGARRLEKLVEQVNGLNADACLIIGDLIDEPAGRLPWAVDPLRRLRAPDGVYAVMGNHEFYAGVVEAAQLMRDANITPIRNAAVNVHDKITIVGLDDATGGGQFGVHKVPIAKLIGDKKSELPIVLMHHTPSRYEEAAAAGVDLMLCAHTHGGQLWPFGHVMRAVYGVEQGLTEMGDMMFYLTNGAGTWGPPMRVGATPELALVRMRSG